MKKSKVLSWLNLFIFIVTFILGPWSVGPALAAPTVTQVESTAVSGPFYSAPVVILGSGFVNGTTKVYVNGVQVTLSLVSPNRLEFNSPGYASEGWQNIVIEVDGTSTDFGNIFYYGIQRMSFTNIDPGTGTSAGGNVVDINGSGFPIDATNGMESIDTTVFFNGKEALDLAFLNPDPGDPSKANKLRLKPPSNAVGPATVEVRSVRTWNNPVVTVVTDSLFLPAGAYRYINPESTPQIVAVYNKALETNPPAGAIVNQGPGNESHAVKIYGGGFLEGANFGVYFGLNEGTEVWVENTPGTVRVGNEDKAYTQIVHVKTPIVSLAGTYDLTVENQDGAVAKAPNPGYQFNLDYFKPLSIDIHSAYMDTPTEITIWGNFFDKDADNVAVLIGNYPAEIVDRDPSGGKWVKVVTPSVSGIEEGYQTIKVSNRLGNSSLYSNNPDIGFFWRYPTSYPFITSMTPNQGLRDQTVTAVISGGNFNPIDIAIEVDGKKLTGGYVVKNSNEIEIQVPPADKVGWVDIRVTNRDGGTTLFSPSQGAGKGYRYLSIPRIDAVAPPAASYKGGNIISVTGRDLLPGAKIYYEYVGATNKTVTQSVYIENSAPNIQDKIQYRSNNDLRFIALDVTNSANAPDFPVNETHYVLEKLWVVNEDGQRAYIPNTMALYKPQSTPQIDSLNPAEVTMNGGTQVTVNGSGFLDKPKVYLGFEPLPNVTFTNANRVDVITIPMPVNGAKQDYILTLINPDNSTATTNITLVRTVTQLNITDVQPASGPRTHPTDQPVPIVTIFGSGFQAHLPPTDTKVYFGNQQAQVNAVYTNYIEVIPPESPVGGPVDVRVVNWDMAVAIKPNGYTYLNPVRYPIIDKITPYIGPLEGGVDIVIEGGDFKPDGNGNPPVVVVGGKQATNVRWEAVVGVVRADGRQQTRVYATVPANTAGWKRVTVSNYDGGITSTDLNAASDDKKGFLYQQWSSQPRITVIDPNTATTAGNKYVYIGGENFINYWDALAGIYRPPTVTFGGVPALSVEYKNDGLLYVLVPPHPVPGVKDVKVLNWDAGLAVKTGGFTYTTYIPAITGVVPNMGHKNGGEIVYITGSNFTAGGTVRFGSSNLPPGALSPGDLTDLNASDSPRLADGQMNPTWDGVTVIDDKTIAVRTPPGNVGPVDVAWWNPDGKKATLIKGFSYTLPFSNPTINSVFPIDGSTSGGYRATITGSDFRDGVAVYFGEKLATDLAKISEAELQVTVPAHAAGKVDVIVFNKDGGRATLPLAFEYKQPTSNPVIKSISPARGPIEGGITMTIEADWEKGTGFQATPKVFLGPNQVDGVVFVDYKTITFTLPAGTVGAVDVTVINPDYGTYTMPKGFTYEAMPLISKITPDVSSMSGGGAVVITGSNFQKGLKVTFGNAQATVKNVTDTEIQLVVPPGPGATDKAPVYVDVTVTNPEGGSNNLVKAFRYLPEGGLPVDKPKLAATAIDRSTIKLTWASVDYAMSYEILMAKAGSTDFRLFGSSNGDTKEGNSIYFLVRGLEANTQYSFKVRAISSGGTGPYSDPISATTKSSSESGWTGFSPPDTEVTQGTQGPTMTIRTAAGAKTFVDLRTLPTVPGKPKIVRWSQEALAAVSAPILVDAGNWKVWFYPPALRQNGGLFTDGYAGISVGAPPAVEKERALLNAQRSMKRITPVSDVYELRLIYEKERSSFVPMAYVQPVTLAVNFNPSGSVSPNRRSVALYYYNGYSRQWERVGGISDTLAISAPVVRSGFYAAFAE